MYTISVDSIFTYNQDVCKKIEEMIKEMLGTRTLCVSKFTPIPMEKFKSGDFCSKVQIQGDFFPENFEKIIQNIFSRELIKVELIK